MKDAILIVEDDDDDLMALKAVLDPLGLDVVRAENGRAALRELLDRDFALVITDLMMPGMNGFELCSFIRKRASCRDMPVIVLTGFDEEGASTVFGYRPGTFDFLRKPVQPEVLLARVTELLARYRPETMKR